MNLGELIIRMIGPILFSAAFIAFISQYDAVDEYLQTVKDRFLGGEVYSQSSVDSDDDVYSFERDGSYEVTGAYLLGVLSAPITENTIVIGNSRDYYQKLVISPSMLDNTTCYTAYRSSLSVDGVNSVKAADSGVWVAGQSFQLDYIVDYSATYVVNAQYASTGGILNITYMKKGD